jgi:hypothetical protein
MQVTVEWNLVAQSPIELSPFHCEGRKLMRLRATKGAMSGPISPRSFRNETSALLLLRLPSSSRFNWGKAHVQCSSNLGFISEHL